MIQEFFVAGQLPGMNEIIAACKSGRGKGNAYSRMKRQWNNYIATVAVACKLFRVTKPVRVKCLWREPNRRRDPDNVQAGVKFLLDSLVSAGILEGDSQRHVKEIQHIVTVNCVAPGVVVTLETD